MSNVRWLNLLWVGPLTVFTAAVAVRAIQWLAVRTLRTPPPQLTASEEPIVFTTLFVAIAVIVFAAVAAESSTPSRTFRRIALFCLVVSCLPDLAIPFGLFRNGTWTLALIFIAMHVAAWAITVEMLTRLLLREGPRRVANSGA